MVYKVLRRFIPLAFLATALCGLVYLAVQQSLRQGANDPQIQMAEDAAARLQAGSTTVETMVPPGPVDIARSLAPYLILYDASGRPVAGNGVLDGIYPGLPVGVFAYTAIHGEDRFTWQPRAGIRQAVVLVNVPGFGFAMAGRSLREVEVREEHAEFEAGGVWLFSIGGLLLLEIIIAVIESRCKRRT